MIVHVPDTVGDLQNAIQNEEADLRGGDTIIRYSDWLARLYGSGIAAAGLDNFPPLTLDNKTPLVTVFGGSEEWGGETLRRRVMVNLEVSGMKPSDSSTTAQSQCQSQPTRTFASSRRGMCG